MINTKTKGWLPPVGTVCEYTLDDDEGDSKLYSDCGFSDGELVEIVAHKTSIVDIPVVIFWSLSKFVAGSRVVSYEGKDMFRPITDTEQVMEAKQQGNASEKPNSSNDIPDSLRSIAERWDEIQWPESSLYGYEVNGQLFHGSDFPSMPKMYVIHKREDFVEARRRLEETDIENLIFDSVNSSHTETMKVLKEHNEALSTAMDATSNAPDEWPSETGIPVTVPVGVETYKYSIIEDSEGKPPIYGQTYLNFPSLTIEQQNALERYALILVDDSQPKQDEWVDGLPPLKTDFEASLKNVDTWFSVKAKAFSDDYVVFETSGTEWAALKSDYEFRPIETPAQAEERERDEFTKAFSQSMNDAGSIPSDFDNSIVFGRVLYDWLKSADRLKDKSDE